MAAVKKVIRGISQIVGEVLVVGGALGTTYVLGFIKGSEAKPTLKDLADKVNDAVEKAKPKTEEEDIEEDVFVEEDESEEEMPPIEVSTNQQED